MRFRLTKRSILFESQLSLWPYQLSCFITNLVFVFASRNQSFLLICTGQCGIHSWQGFLAIQKRYRMNIYLGSQSFHLSLPLPSFLTRGHLETQILVANAYWALAPQGFPFLFQKNIFYLQLGVFEILIITDSE